MMFLWNIFKHDSNSQEVIYRIDIIVLFICIKFDKYTSDTLDSRLNNYGIFLYIRNWYMKFQTPLLFAIRIKQFGLI